MNNHKELLDALATLPGNFHNSGVMPATVLEAIERHCRDLNITYSAETGSGLSTLLFSHLSNNHLVFAKEQFADCRGNSISSVRESTLFRGESVKYIVGPTQQTLPAYTFTEKLQVVLIDGPHGFPFPQLEYYYLYQHLDEGAVLIIDDIHIPTIRHMADVLSEDKMFEKIDTVDSCMFLRRTSAAVFNPVGDDWWLQNYNASRYPDNTRVKPSLFHVRLNIQLEKLLGKKTTGLIRKLTKKTLPQNLLRRLSKLK